MNISTSDKRCISINNNNVQFKVIFTIFVHKSIEIFSLKQYYRLLCKLLSKILIIGQFKPLRFINDINYLLKIKLKK